MRTMNSLRQQKYVFLHAATAECLNLTVLNDVSAELKTSWLFSHQLL